MASNLGSSRSGCHCTALRRKIRFDEARRALRDIPPESPIFGESAVVLLAAQGELDAARKAYSRFREEQRHDHLKGLPFHAMVGDCAEANRIATEFYSEPAGPWIRS